MSHEDTDGTPEEEDVLLFLNAERFVRSVPWRIGASSPIGALTAGQIEDLSSRFEIRTKDLERMSWRLQSALDPGQNINLVGVSTRQAQRQGAERLTETLERLNRADDLLETSLGALGELYINRWFEPENAAALSRIRKRLDLTIQRLAQLHCAIEDLQRVASPMRVTPADKRTIRDRRRGPVLGVLFKTWTDHGPARSYTTDPVSGERYGPLLDFVKTVTEHLTDPPMPVPQNTVVKEHGRWLRRQNDEGDAEFLALWEQRRQERAKLAAAPEKDIDQDRD